MLTWSLSDEGKETKRKRRRKELGKRHAFFGFHGSNDDRLYCLLISVPGMGVFHGIGSGRTISGMPINQRQTVICRTRWHKRGTEGVSCVAIYYQSLWYKWCRSGWACARSFQWIEQCVEWDMQIDATLKHLRLPSLNQIFWQGSSRLVSGQRTQRIIGHLIVKIWHTKATTNT